MGGYGSRKERETEGRELGNWEYFLRFSFIHWFWGMKGTVLGGSFCCVSKGFHAVVEKYISRGSFLPVIHTAHIKLLFPISAFSQGTINSPYRDLLSILFPIFQ